MCEPLGLDNSSDRAPGDRVTLAIRAARAGTPGPTLRSVQLKLSAGLGGTMSVIDCDQHLYESRATWADHIDPTHRDQALAIVDDDLGYPWLVWGDRRIELCDVQHPGET